MGNQSSKQHHQNSGTKPKKFVHWKSAERPSQPGRPILIPVSDQQPDVITLRWDRPRSDGGSPILGYIVEHRRLGSPHWVRATPILVLETEVSISGLEPGWRYQFRTIAENIVGRSDPSELSDALTVTLQRNAITVPRFVAELKDTIAVENQRVEMRVAVVGQPPPEINWFKDGFEIFSSRRTKIVNDNDSSLLIIHQAAFTDEGEIKCTATNRAGHVVTKSRLTVEAPPKIRLPRQYEDGLIVEAEETLRLKVAIAGRPVSTVMWNHEGEVIKNGKRFELINSDKNSCLKIEKIKRIDRGEYTIRAINKLGEDVASFLVTVTARPDPPGKVKLKMSFGRSAILTWTAPIDDGGCKIGNYIVEYFRIGWNVWLKAATTRQLTATLHDLFEGSEYKFRVKAENPYGLSDPSEESEVLFIPDPKRGITKPIPHELPEEKPVPPKRKNLSPLRNFLGVSKKDNVRDKSPTGRSSPSNFQVFDNDDHHHEMSYGASDESLKRSPSRSGGVDVKNSPLQPRSSSSSPKTPQEKSPSPKRNDENNLSMNQKIQNFFQRSPTPQRKSLAAEEVNTNNESSPKPERKEFEDESKSPGLVRKNSGRFDQLNQKVQQLFRRSPSPCRLDQPSEPEADQTPDIKKITSLQRSEEPAKLSVDQSPQQGIRRNQSPSRQLPNQGEQSNPGFFNISSAPRLSLPNPTIEISPPKKEEFTINSDMEKDKRDEVHTSSEFMLVLYPNHKKKSKETEKQESFDLELEEALCPPPISLSSPDLGSEQAYLQEPILRRSVSSTELLYERAMARFYEAVELEESARTKKNLPSQEQTLHEPMRKRLGSMTEADRLSFERRSSLRRKLSGDVHENLAILKIDYKESINPLPKVNPVLNRRPTLEREDTEEFSEDNYKGDSLDYESDYTESTASSQSEDSIEKFKNELMARTKSTSGELETYHPPRRVSDPNFSPYRSPTPDQSTVVLSKPVPLPSPDFVPKPILKRPSSENSVKDEGTNGRQLSPEPVKSDNNVSKPAKSGENNIAKGLKSFFKKEKVPSDQNLVKNGNDKNKTNSIPSNKDDPQKPFTGDVKSNDQVTVAKPVEGKGKPSEEAQKKKLEITKSMEEEARVVAEHYNDIVMEMGSTRKHSVPIYLRGQVYDDEESPEKEDKKKKTEREIEEELIQTYLARPRLSIVERIQVAHVQDISKLALKIPLSAEISSKQHSPVETRKKPTFSPIPSEENPSPRASNDNLPSRGRKIVKTKVKKRILSGSRSRDPSSSDPNAQKSPEARKRPNSRTRIRTESRSPGPMGRKPLKIENQQDIQLAQFSPPVEEIKQNGDDRRYSEDMTEDTQEKVRSTVSYLTDVGLFMFACWVYIFKDARLVLPILALMVYRQLGEALQNSIPDWLKRKKS